MSQPGLLPRALLIGTWLAAAVCFAQRDAEQNQPPAEQPARRATDVEVEAAHQTALASKQAAIDSLRRKQLAAALKATAPPCYVTTCTVIGQALGPSALENGGATGQTISTVHVLRTFAGIDHAGKAIKLLSSTELKAGRSYLITFTINPLEECSAATSVEEPTTQRTNEVAARLAQSRAGVSDKRVFWAYCQPGPRDKGFEEFYVVEDGGFVYRREIPASADRAAERERLAGKLPPEQLRGLIEAVQAARETNVNVPRGMMTIRWTAENGEQFKAFADFPNRPAVDLLARVVMLASLHGAPAAEDRITTRPAR